MSNYNRNSRSGGGDYRRRDSGQREMHKAVCDECGQNCEVPFRPSGDKPIYCSNCFENKGGGSSNRSNRSSGRSSGGSSYGKPDNTNKQLLDQVSSLNKKLDRILVVLESATPKKEVQEPKKVEKKEVKVEVKEEPKEVKKAVKKASKKATPKKEVQEPIKVEKKEVKVEVKEEPKEVKKASKKATPEVK